MTHLFRRIRQQLLGEGKTGKYLKYAIGEIVLVVIGILIALSINNWNEWKKERLLEVNTLKEIKNSIINDSIELNAGVDNYDRSTYKLERMLVEFNDNSKTIEKIVDSLPSAIPFIHVEFYMSGYKLLEARGMDIISNEKLRNTIAQYYESDLKWYEFSLGKYESELKGLNDKWLYENYYGIYSRHEDFVPYNKKALMMDEELIGMVKTRMHYNRGSKYQAIGVLNQIKTLIEMIDEHISNLQLNYD